MQITLGGNCVSASTAALFLALLLVLGVQPLVAGLLVVVAMFGVALLLRHAVIHGNLILATSRVLNLQALQMDLAWTLGHREILVPGDEKTLRPWSLRDRGAATD